MWKILGKQLISKERKRKLVNKGKESIIYHVFLFSDAIMSNQIIDLENYFFMGEYQLINAKVSTEVVYR